MAVYTQVSTGQARQLMRSLKLGELTQLQGCASGIENTNYFVSTERDGLVLEYVLTLFERLTAAQQHHVPNPSFSRWLRSPPRANCASY